MSALVLEHGAGRPPLRLHEGLETIDSAGKRTSSQAKELDLSTRTCLGLHHTKKWENQEA